MNIRQFMAAIAVANKMNIDEPCFEYDIDFDDVRKVADRIGYLDFF